MTAVTPKKIFIQNRKGQKIVVVIEQVSEQKGLSFIMHGLGGYKEQKQLRKMAEAFLANSYTVITFDTTNTFGESDGSLDDATTTNYFEDLCDVIEWAKGQPWYQAPFCLSGHSLGGISTALYAEQHPELVKGLAPTGTVVSGKLSMEVNDKWKEWKRLGYNERVSTSRPWLKAKIKWSHMEDRLKYDLMPHVAKLTMPVLMIVGTEDESTPLMHQKILFDALPGKKEIHVIEGAKHTIREAAHLKLVHDYFDSWIKTLE
jgi:pimeloyl-ACP methyl ester carboxylesterase